MSGGFSEPTCLNRLLDSIVRGTTMRQPPLHRTSLSPAHNIASEILREKRILISNSSLPTSQPRISLAPRKKAETKTRVFSERTSSLQRRATPTLRRDLHPVTYSWCLCAFVVMYFQLSIANTPTLGVLVLGFRFSMALRNSSLVIRNSEKCHTVSLLNEIFHA